jgi:hypothetical protein
MERKARKGFAKGAEESPDLLRVLHAFATSAFKKKLLTTP